MKRFVLSVFWLISCLGLLAQNENAYVQQKNQLYALYEDYLKYGKDGKTENVETIATSIRHQFNGLDEHFRSAIVDEILIDVVNAYETENHQEFLTTAERALFILNQDDPARFDILATMAEVYAANKNKELLQATINQMNQIPAALDKDNVELIRELQSKADNLLSFPNLLDGYWVSNQYSSDPKKNHQPWLILDIYSNHEGKWAEISELSGLSTETLEQKFSTLRRTKSFSFDTRKGSFMFSFYKNKYQQGDAEGARSLLNMAQQTRATAAAASKDPRATLGESVSANIVGGLFSMGYDLLADAVAVSRMSEDVIFITGFRRKDDVLDCHMDYQLQASNSAVMRTVSSTIVNKDFTLLRWNKEDNIVFALPDCRPISPYTVKLTRDMDLYKIRKETSFWQFKNGGVAVLGLVGGAACTYYGVKTILDNERLLNEGQYDFSETATGNMTGDDYKRTKIKGIVALSLGTLITINVPIFERAIRKDRRAKAITDYNSRQFIKLVELRDE